VVYDGAPSVEHRPSPLRSGSHGGGNGVLKAGGVVHPWGCSAVSSPQWRGDAVSMTTGLGAHPLSWWWIGVGCEACRSSMRAGGVVWAVLQGGRCSGERQCCSSELPRSPAGFSVLTMVVVISKAAVEVFGARQCCIQWLSAVAVLSIPPLRRTSSRGRVVLCVGVVHRSWVVPTALVSFVGL
jgi:hypothetical protein